MTNVSFSAKVSQEKFDVTVLHAQPELAAQERMVDNGEGKVEVRATSPNHSMEVESPIGSLVNAGYTIWHMTLSTFMVPPIISSD